MKKAYFLLLLFMIGCYPAPPIQQIPSQGLWSNTTKDKAYSACLTALQFLNFNLVPIGTSKESGLIIADRDPFRVDDYNPRFTGSYKLQIMVSEINERKIFIDVNCKATRSGPSNSGLARQWVVINNQIAADLDEFFTQVERLIGKADYFKRFTLR